MDMAPSKLIWLISILLTLAADGSLMVVHAPTFHTEVMLNRSLAGISFIADDHQYLRFCDDASATPVV